MNLDLWVPNGGEYLGSTPIGTDVNGGKIVSNKLRVQYTDQFGVVHPHFIYVISDESTSQSEIDHQIGYAVENFIEDSRQKYNKRPATTVERKEAGKAIEEFRQHAASRRESTNRKLYYEGVRK